MPAAKTYRENQNDRKRHRYKALKYEESKKEIHSLKAERHEQALELERLKNELRRYRVSEGVPLEFRDVNTELPDGPELVAILEAWAEDVLVIPHGVLQGKKFEMAEFQRKFLKNAFLRGKGEGLLCVARKNAKSSLIAVLLLGILVGPLNVPNFRATVVSLTGKLAGELRLLIENFFDASLLGEEIKKAVTINKSPAPGHILGLHGSRVDFLSADKGSGHAVGADIAIIDELGLIEENQRELVDAAFSSLGSRNGRLVALSIRGDGPHLQEMLDRQLLPHVYVDHYCLDEDDDPYVEENWYKANPGLSGDIKSLEYMRRAAQKAKASPESEAKFFAHDLNMRVDPSSNLIVTTKDYEACCVGEGRVLPRAKGQVVIGIDFGGATSMTAACALWPETGRCEVLGAFPDRPPLADRSRYDGKGDLYVRLERAGEIVLYPGRLVDPGEFILDVLDLWGEHGVDVLISDKYSSTFARQTVEQLNLPVKLVTRYSAENATTDISSAKRLIMNRMVTFEPTGILAMGIRDSRVKFRLDGSMQLERKSSKSRIDALSAFCHAAGGMVSALSGGRGVKLGWDI